MLGLERESEGCFDSGDLSVLKTGCQCLASTTKSIHSSAHQI